MHPARVSFPGAGAEMTLDRRRVDESEEGGVWWLVRSFPPYGLKNFEVFHSRSDSFRLLCTKAMRFLSRVWGGMRSSLRCEVRPLPTSPGSPYPLPAGSLEEIQSDLRSSADKSGCSARAKGLPFQLRSDKKHILGMPHILCPFE